MIQYLDQNNYLVFVGDKKLEFSKEDLLELYYSIDVIEDIGDNYYEEVYNRGFKDGQESVECDCSDDYQCGYSEGIDEGINKAEIIFRKEREDQYKEIDDALKILQEKLWGYL